MLKAVPTVHVHVLRVEGCRNNDGKPPYMKLNYTLSAHLITPPCKERSLGEGGSQGKGKFFLKPSNEIRSAG